MPDPTLDDILTLFPNCRVCGYEIRRGERVKARVIPGLNRAAHGDCDPSTYAPSLPDWWDAA